MKKPLAASLLILALAACTAVLPASPGTGTRGASLTGSGAPGGTAVAPGAPSASGAASIASRGYGSLQLEVRWPALPQSSVQLLPTSTTWLAVTVAACATCSPIVPITYVARPASDATTSVTVSNIPQGNNYDVTVDAYNTSSTSQPVVGTTTAIAAGTGNVNIWASWVSPAAISLEPSFIPTLGGTPSISAMTTDIGKPGDSVTFTGANLGAVGSEVPTVVFGAMAESTASDGTITGYTGGSTASIVTPSGTTKLTATVPQGATSGDVIILNDGVPSSSSNFVFWVASGLTSAVHYPAPSVTTPTGYSAVTPQATNSGWPGSTILYGATTSVQASLSLDIPGQTSPVGWPIPPGPHPSPSWFSNNSIEGLGLPPAFQYTNSNSSAGSISTSSGGPGGGGPTVFQATKTSGTTSVGVVDGPSLSASPIVLTVGGVSTVSVSPSPVTLASTAATTSLTATLTTSLPFNDGVDWYFSQNTANLQASSVGTDSIVIGASNGSTGTATVIAQCVDDPAMTATISVTIQ